MQNRGLYILVEGVDDERFLKGVIEVCLENRYYPILYYHYQHKKRGQIRNFLYCIQEMDYSYLFFRDNDCFPCILSAKEKVKNCISNIDINKVIIVKREIESWYMAGINDSTLKRWKIKRFSSTDQLTKEGFVYQIPKNFPSKVEFMIEIINNYSLEIAKSKNKSLEYFCNKFVDS